jgi:hypothetical protein
MEVRIAQSGPPERFGYGHPAPSAAVGLHRDGCPSCDDLPMTTASRWVRLRTVLGWPIGIALVSWRYMWRTTPLHRSEQSGSAEDLPGRVHHHDGHGRQGLDAGVGPMLHRTYAVRIVNSALGPAALIDMVADKLDRASPEMAVFRKTRGADGPLRYGDEFLVRMPGP